MAGRCDTPSMGPMEIFETVEPPTRLRRNRFASAVAWWTWSREFRKFLREWRAYAHRAGRPAVKLVGRRRPYGETYSHHVEGGPLGRELNEFARSLMSSVSRGMFVCLDGLLDGACGRRGLHLLFAAMRESIVTQRNDPRAALYNPLGSTGPDEGDFPLHADLYAPRFLFNVFDDVPGDGSGASVFLAHGDFRRALRETRSLGASWRQRILRCLAPVVSGDRYDEFWGLLHGSERPWRGELRQNLRRAQHVVLFARGQGYLLDDRRWLHGREAPNGGVTRDRIHRLIFDSAATALARRHATVPRLEKTA